MTAFEVYPTGGRRYEGCCRAAVDSEGFAHDHTEWFAKAQTAEAEVARLTAELAEARNAPFGSNPYWQLRAERYEGALESSRAELRQVDRQLRAAEAQLALQAPVIAAAKAYCELNRAVWTDDREAKLDDAYGVLAASVDALRRKQP